MMCDKIVDGFETVTQIEFESCAKEAERELAHLHPDNIDGPADWRLFRIEDPPPDMTEFPGVPRDECIVIVSRDGGVRPVYRRTTRLHPIVFDNDGYCQIRFGDERPLGRLSDIPPDRVDWNIRHKINDNYNEAVEGLTEELAEKLDAETLEWLNKDGKEALEFVERHSKPIKAPISASLYRYRPPALIPTRKWLYAQKLIRGFPSLTVAPSGLGKSSKTLVEVVAMATGQDLLGIGWKCEKPLRVWYWCGEDPREEIERRIAAILLHYQINPAIIGDRLFIDSGRDRNKSIQIAFEERGSMKIAVPHCREIYNTIRSNRLDVMIIDPFVSSHGVSENNNTYIDRVAKIWREIAEKGACAVEWIHHVRKPAYGTHEFTVDDGRGASALLAASRVAEVLNPMSKDEAGGFGITESQRRSFFRCDNGKSSMTPPPEKAAWFKFESVELGNGNDVRQSDSVGVVTTWTPPKPLDGVHGNHVEEIRRRCTVGAFREDFRSPAWAGYMVAEVLGFNGNDPAVKKRVKGMLAAWIRNGALKVEERPDGKRVLRRFVLPGDDAVTPDKPFGV
jgi:hypothetical protein